MIRSARGGAAATALPLMLLCTCVAAACSGKVTQAGGLEVKIFTTNVTVGTDFDELKVDVSQETAAGWKPRGTYDNSSLPPSFPFPTTIAIAAGPSSDQNTRITVTGLLGGNPVVRTEAQTSVPTDQVLELDMYLTRSCLNMLCTADSTTCVKGACETIVVPASTLVAYTPVDGVGTNPGGSGSSGGNNGPDASGNGDGGTGSSGGSGGGNDATVTPTCDVAACGGCCDPKGGCVTPMSTCSNGMACTGPGGTCTGSGTNCPPQMAQAIMASCLAGFGCYLGGCSCMTCAPGQTCVNNQCTSSTSVDSGGPCSPQSCSYGCCDLGGACIPTGSSCPASGGVCSGSLGAACAVPGSCTPAMCPNGCCANNGSCITLGNVCPNGRTCSAAGTNCAMAGSCGAAGQACCTTGVACVSGTCSGGTCTAGTTCSVANEPVPGNVSVNATIGGKALTATDGFVVLTGSGSGPISAMFYLMNYANACGYAQSNSTKSGGEYVTFGVSPTSGTGYSSLVGGFRAGGANLGPGITTESPSGSACVPQYLAGMCGSGSLTINITSASATQVTGTFSGTCTAPDRMVGTFTLPVCGTSLGTSGTSACCP